MSADNQDNAPIELLDGTAPATPAELLALLDVLGVETETFEHPAVFTVEQSKALRGELEGGHTKNLFLRNKKGRMWLVVCCEDTPVDLKALAGRLGSGRLSFASPDRLGKHLGVRPGAVTPFSVLNDRGGDVQVVIEARALEVEPLNFHPLTNSKTTAISRAGLLTFLEATDHAPEILDFDEA